MAQIHQDTYGPQGFQVIQIFHENFEGTEPTQADLALWADSHLLSTVPVLKLPSAETEPGGLHQQWDQNDVLPTYWILGPDMTIIAEDRDHPFDPALYMR